MQTLLDANFYSILYYNSVVWLTVELKSSLKQSLLSISANALRTCLMHSNNKISFERLHAIVKKCTPSQIMLYQSALHLHKVLNQEVLSFESIKVLNNMTCSRRQTTLPMLPVQLVSQKKHFLRCAFFVNFLMIKI